MKTFFIEHYDYDDRIETFAVFSEDVKDKAIEEFYNLVGMGDFDARLELNEYDVSEIVDFKNRKGTNILRKIKEVVKFDDMPPIEELLGNVGDVAGAE